MVLTSEWYSYQNGIDIWMVLTTEWYWQQNVIDNRMVLTSEWYWHQDGFITNFYTVCCCITSTVKYACTIYITLAIRMGHLCNGLVVWHLVNKYVNSTFQYKVYTMLHLGLLFQGYIHSWRCFMFLLEHSCGYDCNNN